MEVTTPLIGLDVGDRRIGIAMSDPTRVLASPIGVYHRVGREADVDHVVEVMQQNGASSAVVGLPVNMNGSEGPQAQKTRDFAEVLVNRGISVDLWDERLSTIEATRRLQEQKRRKRSRPRYVDAEAAALILQNYLDSLRMRFVE